ncbi:MAG: hypothetical protein ACLT76_02885 [Clostridium fessum]
MKFYFTQPSSTKLILHVSPAAASAPPDLFFALSGALALIMAWRSGKKIWYQEDFPGWIFLIICSCH